MCVCVCVHVHEEQHAVHTAKQQHKQMPSAAAQRQLPALAGRVLHTPVCTRAPLCALVGSLFATASSHATVLWWSGWAQSGGCHAQSVQHMRPMWHRRYCPATRLPTHTAPCSLTDASPAPHACPRPPSWHGHGHTHSQGTCKCTPRCFHHQPHPPPLRFAPI
jgi:hypothetical protein